MIICWILQPYKQPQQTWSFFFFIFYWILNHNFYQKNPIFPHIMQHQLIF